MISVSPCKVSLFHNKLTPLYYYNGVYIDISFGFYLICFNGINSLFFAIKLLLSTSVIMESKLLTTLLFCLLVVLISSELIVVVGWTGLTLDILWSVYSRFCVRKVHLYFKRGPIWCTIRYYVQGYVLLNVTFKRLVLS